MVFARHARDLSRRLYLECTIVQLADYLLTEKMKRDEAGMKNIRAWPLLSKLAHHMRLRTVHSCGFTRRIPVKVRLLLEKSVGSIAP